MLLRSVRRRIATRWTWARVIELLAINVYWSLRIARNRIEVNKGTHTEKPTDESVAYIEQVFDEYKQYGHIECFQGVAAEIGPGDHAGVALLMRRDGCARVDLIERFMADAPAGQQADIYRQLSERHDLHSFRIGDTWNNRSLSGIAWQPPQPAESYFKACPSCTYNFIVSRAVLEAIRNPVALLADMLRCLRPDGHLIHQVDLTDHKSFSRGHDELTWLGLPSWLWPLLSSSGFVPNRVLLHEYRAFLEHLREQGRIEFEISVARLASVGRISPARPWREIPGEQRAQAMAFIEANRARLTREFRDVPAEDLAVTSGFLIVHKLGGRG